MELPSATGKANSLNHVTLVQCKGRDKSKLRVCFRQGSVVVNANLTLRNTDAGSVDEQQQMKDRVAKNIACASFMLPSSGLMPREKIQPTPQLTLHLRYYFLYFAKVVE